EKFIQDCNESGIVVVQIEVDRSGRVTRAIPGVKGTTNNATCLTDPAKRAALATRFNSDSKAPAKQVGTIIYNFKLSE
ncbi:energy transducer TonB, partial [Salinimicrobium sp. CDJ15-91]|nr:energy transducer TonB [Salinimicrobium oceani]